jgi:hypothetical protein
MLRVRYTVATLAGNANRHIIKARGSISQYMFNMLWFQVYAGSRDVLSMTGLYRQRMVCIEGAPNHIVPPLIYQSKKGKVGIGFQAHNDQIGFKKYCVALLMPIVC